MRDVGTEGAGSAPRVDHPWFSRAYRWVEGPLERAVGEARRAQNAQAWGRTLVIGAGTGLDIPVLGERVTEVVLLEPDATMRRTLARRFPALPVLSRSAEATGLADEACDTVVGSLVLCSVADVGRVLEEISRVLTVGGQYLFLEHVRSPGPTTYAVQRTLDPVWSRLGGGCHLTHEVEVAVRASTLTLTDLEVVRPGGILPVVRARAVKGVSAQGEFQNERGGIR